MYQHTLRAQQAKYIQIGFLTVDAHLQQLPLLITSRITENLLLRLATSLCFCLGRTNAYVSHRVGSCTQG